MAAAPYTHEIRIRYGEVDMQRVVFNAHYLAYCDDAADCWFRSLAGGIEAGTWDAMVKRADITWHGGASIHELLSIDLDARRWGNTSFDVGFEGRVGDRAVFTAILTYVAVTLGTTDTVRVPDEFRSAAGGP
jgi:YbgC/YbaW family acyl-CoA thioester hydrolase